MAKDLEKVLMGRIGLEGLTYCELARVDLKRSASEAQRHQKKTGKSNRRTALIAGRRASLLAVSQEFTALTFWFFCVKAKEQQI
jgi:hypothetical protein